MDPITIAVIVGACGIGALLLYNTLPGLFRWVYRKYFKWRYQVRSFSVADNREYFLRIARRADSPARARRVTGVQVAMDDGCQVLMPTDWLEMKDGVWVRRVSGVGGSHALEVCTRKNQVGTRRMENVLRA